MLNSSEQPTITPQVTIYTGNESNNPFIRKPPNPNPGDLLKGDTKYGYKTEEEQTFVARSICKTLGLKSGDKVLEVGWGGNDSHLKVFEEAGLICHALDRRPVLGYGTVTFDRSQVTPTHVGDVGRIKIWQGDIKHIQAGPPELNGGFNFIHFNGSFFAGLGKCNHTILERGEEPLTIVNTCSTLLAPGGWLSIVSARYAQTGAGFSIDQYAVEKNLMMGIVNNLPPFQYARVIAFGLTPSQLSAQLPNEVSSILPPLQNISPDQPGDLGSLVRVDAIFAQRSS